MFHDRTHSIRNLLLLMYIHVGVVIIHFYVFEKMMYLYQMSKSNDSMTKTKKRDELTNASVFNKVIGTGG
jgi:hypothetical protein